MNGIAIVGAACHFGDANSPEALWETAMAGRRAFRRLPSERLNSEDYVSSDRNAADVTYAQQVSVLNGYHFDRDRFRVAGRTFRQTDMAHWLALETAAAALDDAGYPDAEGIARDTTAVLVGNTLTGEFSRANQMRLRWPYVKRTVAAQLDQRGWSAADQADFLAQLESDYKRPFPEIGDETLAGGLSNTIAGRICNHFDLHGGGFTLDAACASSLLAVANACSMLAVRDVDVALVGGVDLSLDPFELVGFAKVGALADGEMRVFDRDSHGFCPGEGCGFVVLVRAEDAVAEQRRIYATIRGWGISSDGSGGITRPEIDGQLLALQRAYRRAGFSANSVAYFEGHGTGTTVGDATELQSLIRLRTGDHNQPLVPAVIGSIKANIGHTKAAAGVAGLLKATWALHKHVIPPNTGVRNAHPALRDAKNVLRVTQTPVAWPTSQPMRAGVSGMGFGGINVHLALQGTQCSRRTMIAPDQRRLAQSRQDCELFLFAAADLSQLRSRLSDVATYAVRLSAADLTDCANELSHKLRPLGWRAAIVAADADELAAGLARLLEWTAHPERLSSHQVDPARRVSLGTTAAAARVGFLFPGQSSPIRLDGGCWRQRFETVDQIGGWMTGPLASSMDTRIAQPAIIRATIAGLRVLDSLGIHAKVAIGNSLGELAAYHWAGAFDETTLLEIATLRGRAMSELSAENGAMASIAADRDTVGALLNGDPSIVISGMNSPRQTIVSGRAVAVDRTIQDAQRRGLTAVKLPVSHAFHSPLVAASAQRLRQYLAQISVASLQHSVISTITGKRLGSDQSLVKLLERQITAPVRLMDAVAEAANDVDLWLEVGTGSVMRGIVQGMVDAPVLSLDCCGDSLKGLLQAAGAAYTAGAADNMNALYDGRFARPFDLNWKACFLENPCEYGRQTDTSIDVSSDQPNTSAISNQDGSTVADATCVSTTPCHRAEMPTPCDGSERNGTPVPIDQPDVRQLVRRLVAEHLELEVLAVSDSDRLLGDLHLSSIAVGQIVASASRCLGLPSLEAPTQYAGATVLEIATALEEQRQVGSSVAAPEEVPDGIDSWVAGFEVQWVEQPLREVGAETIGAELSAPHQWTIVGGDELLALQLKTMLPQTVRSGVLVCLPRDAKTDTDVIERLLNGAQTARQSNADQLVILQPDEIAGGFAKTFYLEHPQIDTAVITFGSGDVHCVAERILREIQMLRGFVQSNYRADGTRLVPRLVTLDERRSGRVPLDSEDCLLVTGGGKGICAECALRLAMETGVRLAVIGRSDPTADEALANNLARMRAAGADCRYYVANVSDADAVRQVVDQVRRDFGDVTAVLHGAGTNTPQLLDQLDVDDFQRTLAPKVSGLKHILKYVDATRLRLLVTFSSIIARLGMRGEADYALANEWLTNATSNWQAEHPHCRCLAVEWSVWSGVGMGERLGRIDMLKQQGISAISPEQGVDYLCRLLSDPPDAPAVVASGRFGDPATLPFRDTELPLLRFIETPRYHAPGVELVVDSILSLDTDPYLADHAYQRVPLLPAVVGLEAMAQAMTAVAGHDTGDVLVFEDVELARPIAVPETGEVTVRVAALRSSRDTVQAAVRCEESSFEKDHFRSGVRRMAGDQFVTERFANWPIEANRLPFQPTAERPIRNVAAEVYEPLLFHQGRFRRVASYIHVCATECIAELQPPDEKPWFAGYVGGQTLLLGDPASRDAVIHCIQVCIPHRTLLPIGADRIEIPLSQPSEGRRFVHARQRCETGDRFTYDAEVLDSDGAVIERWTGLRLRAVADGDPNTLWSLPIRSCYLQRQARQQLADLSIEVRLTTKCHGNDTQQRRALLETIGVKGKVCYRVDGKPEAACGRHISLSHSNNVTLAVGSGHPVACDIQHVSTRSWPQLLGNRRWNTASHLAQRYGESTDTAATRVWAALECLKKLGRSWNSPLVIREENADWPWIMFQVGKLTVATFATSILDEPTCCVMAISSENQTAASQAIDSPTQMHLRDDARL